MATKTINTRIKLRVDTAANWAAHDTAAKGGVKIYKGEAALSLLSGDNAGKYEIRYGISDEGNYWSELTPNNFMVEASNVKGLLSSLYSYQLVEDKTQKGKFTLQKKLSTEETWTDVTSVTLSFTSTGTYSETNPIALKDYVDKAAADATTQYFEAVRGTVTDGNVERAMTDTEVITKYFADHSEITVKGGSTFVIKTSLGKAGEYEYIAFTYDTTTNPDAPVWRAMDGNYNAENVYFTKDIVATYAWGQYTLKNGKVTIPSAGKNVYELFDDVLSKESAGTRTADSSVSFTSVPNFKEYEVGSTTGTLSYALSKSVGSYQYGPATGVTFSDYKINFNGQTQKTTETGTFNSFTVTDTTNATLSGTYDATAGASAYTNKGRPNEDAGFTRVTTTAKSDAAIGGSRTIKGFRYTFYGKVNTKGTITSNTIRGLTGKTTSNLSNTSVDVTNSLRVIVAIPKARPAGAAQTSYIVGKTLTNCLDVGDSNKDIIASFNTTEVDVEGANGATAITYKVWYIDFASAHDADTFKLTTK